MTLETQPISPSTVPPTNPQYYSSPPTNPQYYTSTSPTATNPPRTNATFVNPNYVGNPNYNPNFVPNPQYQQQYYGQPNAVPIIPPSSVGYGGAGLMSSGGLETNPRTGFAEYKAGGSAQLIAYMLLIMGIPFLLPFPFFCSGIIFIAVALNLKRSVIVFADDVHMLQIVRETVITKIRSSVPTQQIPYTDVASVANTLVPGVMINYQPVYDTVLQLRNGTNIPLSASDVMYNAQSTAQLIRSELNKRGAIVA